jgi:peroxiredoxin
VTSRAEPFATSLQYQLDEITANTRALVPPERLAITEQVIAALRDTHLEQQILPAQAAAPPFELTAGNNKCVNSGDLLALGPLVLKFFRGRWDPYDMTELEVWQTLQPALRERRALLVAVSPQTPRQNAFTADRHNLTFPLLSDPACAVAGQFRLAYTVPDATRLWYRSMLVNIPFLNGDESWRLPLPATFLVAPDGTILFAEANADHRIRPEPAHVLALLDSTGS